MKRVLITGGAGFIGAHVSRELLNSRLHNRRPPLIFEVGEQRRDSVSVHDVARAFRLTLEVSKPKGEVFNIGSGTSHSISEVAREMAIAMGRASLEPTITGRCRYRMGDIRHCFADISLARKALGYIPQVSFEGGIAELATSLEDQVVADRGEEACAELDARGLSL